MQNLDQISQYIGQYFSKEWVMKNVLQMDDDDIKQMKKEMDEEEKNGEYDNMGDDEQQPAQGVEAQPEPDNSGQPGVISGVPEKPVEQAIPGKPKRNGVKK